MTRGYPTTTPQEVPSDQGASTTPTGVRQHTRGVVHHTPRGTAPHPPPRTTSATQDSSGDTTRCPVVPAPPATRPVANTPRYLSRPPGYPQPPPGTVAQVGQPEVAPHRLPPPPHPHPRPTTHPTLATATTNPTQTDAKHQHRRLNTLNNIRPFFEWPEAAK